MITIKPGQRCSTPGAPHWVWNIGPGGKQSLRRSGATDLTFEAVSSWLSKSAVAKLSRPAGSTDFHFFLTIEFDDPYLVQDADD